MITNLGRVADFVNGGAWSQNEYSSDGIPVVRVTNIKGDEIVMADCKFLPLSARNRYAKHTLRRGDLVVATVGSHPSQPGSVVGRPAIVRGNIEGALLNQNAVIIRSSSPAVDQNWLGWFGRTLSFRSYIIGCARGSANQVRMSISLMKEMSVDVPPIEIQQRVAYILTVFDDLIELNRKRIIILSEMASRIFDEWLVQYRFPGCRIEPLVDTLIGPIPPSWSAVPIGSLISYTIGGTWGAEESSDETPESSYIIRRDRFFSPRKWRL
jgi:type I restriction enzyme S subunit